MTLENDLPIVFLIENHLLVKVNNFLASWILSVRMIFIFLNGDWIFNIILYFQIMFHFILSSDSKSDCIKRKKHRKNRDYIFYLFSISLILQLKYMYWTSLRNRIPVSRDIFKNHLEIKINFISIFQTTDIPF